MPETERETRKIPDLYSEYLHETNDLPDGWMWFEVDSDPERVPDGYVRFRGAVTPIGPRTGRPNWRKMDRATERTLFVRWADFAAWKLERARDRGECPDCYGWGEQIASASVDGRTWRTCRSCSGSGAFAASTGSPS